MTASEHITSRITDEDLEELRSLVGVTRGPGGEPGESTRIARSQIRHWAVMTGDMRPLFVDLEYAQRSPWKTLVAPPGALLHEDRFDPEIEGLRGCKAILDAAELRWQLPIRLGDVLVSESAIREVEEVSQAPDLGRAARLLSETRVKNQDGESVGTARLRWTCYERGSGGQRALYGDRKEPHVYDQDAIESLGEEYKREEPRGARLLPWEEVSVGDELQPVLKGPTTRDRTMGPGIERWYWGQLQGWECWEQRPELFFANENGAPEPIVAIDWNHHRAQRWGGTPGALESNTDHVHWVVHLILNWTGDCGFLRRLDLRFPGVNMVGDVTRSYGRVTDTRREGERGIAELEVWQDNQLGQRITRGTAEVVLPVAAEA